MIKVLHVTGAMNRGGAEVMLMDIFRNISKDVHFDFLVNHKKKSGITSGDFDEEIKSRGAQIKYIPVQWDLGIKRYCFEFKKIIDELGTPDIVHIHLNAKSGVIAMAAKKAGVQHIIVHAHADLKFRGSFLSRLVSTLELKFQKILIAKYGDYYWGCSQEANLSLFYKHLLTPLHSAVINNAVDVKEFQQVSKDEVGALRLTYNLQKDTIVFGNIGRVVRHKNVLFIIEILNEIKKANIDFVFVFAGRADDPTYLLEINNKADSYGLKERVIYLDVRDDVPVVMSSFDVFIGPALKEGFGLVAVEAQAAGVPSVLYKGFPRSVDMGLNLVNFQDTFDLDKWVKACTSLKLKRTDLDVVGNAIIAKGFDSRTNTNTIEKMYKKIINE
ncbi:glycosyltransferase [Flavobacterium glaciei]|uniref:Glycosyltransferase EpsF n=1 Tax=Flavobacterium glaciei TaxID=386300 RepID=A0A562Q5X7_9FLAO|nr:glycosyltransferase [Flavobacterium glaciei]RDI58372.1 glycosyltransferase EpsF [Flavobacterium glaciei]TWI52157.1 glycosyltransferase EpsF [Flavobacterium glaciei]